MLPYFFSSMAQLRKLVAHYGWHIDSYDDIRDSDGKLLGSILARSKKSIRVGWWF